MGIITVTITVTMVTMGVTVIVTCNPLKNNDGDDGDDGDDQLPPSVWRWRLTWMP
jgi:hypothetical protein